MRKAIQIIHRDAALGFTAKIDAIYDDETGEIESGTIQVANDANEPRLDCIERGEEIDTVPCETCAGSVRLKVFRCRIYHQTTIAKPVAGAACCATCPDYTPPAERADNEPET